MTMFFTTASFLRTKQHLIFCTLAFCFLVPASGSSHSINREITQDRRESRVALLIGNSAYKVGMLRNPINDARALSEKLKQLGFSVITKLDISREDTIAAIQNFGEKIRSPNAVGVFYFAGHGLQFEGKNFLIPIDAEIRSSKEIPIQGIDLGQVLQAMGAARNALNLVILDACRDNPYGKTWRSAAPQGLTVVEAPAGILIGFATAPGSVASDGDGQNGIYTRHLLVNLDNPGQPIEQMFKLVRLGVMKDTSRAQIPWENSSLVSDFYFKPNIGRLEKRATAQDEAEDIFWKEVVEQPNIFQFVAFLRNYPKSVHADQALHNINILLRKIRAPQITKNDLSEFLREAYLGVEMHDLSDLEAAFRGLHFSNGVILHTVYRNSVAEKAGIQPADVITDINGRSLQNTTALLETLRGRRAGDLLEIGIIRDRKRLTVRAVTERTPVNMSLSNVARLRNEKKDHPGALEILNYLVIQRLPMASQALGAMYMLGLGVERDHKAAANLLKAASDEGFAYAAHLMGALHASGEGVEQSDSKAYAYYRQAAVAGLPSAAQAVGALLLAGRGTNVDYKEAKGWLESAAEQGQPTSQFLLGAIFEYGLGVTIDLSAAEKWYSLAASGGNEQARSRLRDLRVNK